MNDYAALGLGVTSAGIGGELFVRGTVGLSQRLRISPALVSVTLAAMATSSPELTIAINSGLDGTPEIALGDALGSNVVNVLLVLGIALAISGIRSPIGTIRRDFPFALLAPLIAGVLLLDGTRSDPSDLCRMERGVGRPGIWIFIDRPYLSGAGPFYWKRPQRPAPGDVHDLFEYYDNEPV